MAHFIEDFSSTRIDADSPICFNDLTGEIGYPALESSDGGVYSHNGRKRRFVLMFGDISFCRIWQDYPESHHVK